MSLFQRLRGERTVTGLDIGTHSLKLAKVRQQKEGYFLEATGIQELPPGTIEGGLIKDKDALINAVSTLITKCDPSIVEVAISMSGHGIISDKMTFKVATDENDEELILWQAAQRSPFDVDDITLDYKILHRSPDSNEVEALVVAAKNQMMVHYLDLLYDAGLKPVAVDVDAFAVANCYAFSMGYESDEGTVALIHIGHELTNVTFIKDGVYHSTRDVSTAGEFFNKILQRNLSVSGEEAISIIKGRHTGSIDRDMLHQSLEYAGEELSSGIDLAFSYYKSSEKSDEIKKIILSGGGAYIPNIVSLLEKRHDSPISILNPLAYLNYNPDLFGAINPQNIASLLTIAIGLGLRRVEG